MSEGKNCEVVVRFLREAWSLGDLGVVDDLVAPDAVPSNLSSGPGPESWKSDIGFYRHNIGGLSYLVDDIIAAGDKVVARWTASGADTIGFLGRPPTGVPLTFTGITIYRLVDGRIVEHWAEFDSARLRHALREARGESLEFY